MDLIEQIRYQIENSTKSFGVLKVKMSKKVSNGYRIALKNYLSTNEQILNFEFIDGLLIINYTSRR